MSNEDQDDDDNRPKREDLFLIHSRMLLALFVATVVLIVAIAVPLLKAYLGGEKSPYPIFLLVLMTGALGAFVSALQRSHSFEGIAPVLLGEYKKAQTNWFLYIYAIIPPLIGAIAAVVMYVFFQSEVLSSLAFPEFTCKTAASENCNKLSDFFEYGPKGMTDYAKVLLWAFIAGFSERLVPDIIGKLAKQVNDA